MKSSMVSNLLMSAAVAGLLAGSVNAQDKPAAKKQPAKPAAMQTKAKQGMKGKDGCNGKMEGSKGKDGCNGKMDTTKAKDSCKGKDGCKGKDDKK
jgi:hypothetical protein